MNFAVCATGMKGFSFLKNLCKHPGIVLTYDNGELDQHAKIVEYCQSNKIKVVGKNHLIPEGFEAVFAVGWQYFIKDNLEKLIVFHDSYVPELRGFSPTVTSLINRKKYLGVTALRPTSDFSKGPDYGKVFERKKIPIEYPMLLAKAFSIVGSEYAVIANKIIEGKLRKPSEINYSGSTYSMWRDVDDLRIDWSKSAEEISGKINALGYPYSGATTIYQDRLLSILEGEEHTVQYVINDREQHVGKVFRIVDGNPLVVCGSGIVELKLVTNDKGKKIKFSKIRRRFK